MATPPPPTKLKRFSSEGDTPTISTNKKEEIASGLKEALKLVQSEAARIKDKGLTAFSFFYGFSICLLTAYLIGAFPESVWIVYGLQAILILGYRLYVDIPKTKPRQYMYFFDFCWIANFIFAILAFYMLLQVIDRTYFSGSIFPTSSISSKVPWMGRVVILFATGPLGWSVIGLRNKLLLHDIQNFSATFIHLWPCIIALTFRTHPDQVISAYPGLFDALTGIKDNNIDAGFFHLMQLGSLSYFVWWTIFTLWMILHGRFQSIEGTGADTVYMDLVQQNKVVRGFLNVKGKTYMEIANNASKIRPCLTYMCAHAVVVNITFMFATLCYQHIKLHFIFCIVCLSCALYNASMYYAYLMTQNIPKKLAKEIQKRKKST